MIAQRAIERGGDFVMRESVATLCGDGNDVRNRLAALQRLGDAFLNGRIRSGKGYELLEG